MPLTSAQRDEILRQVAREGNPRLEEAPLAAPPDDLPPGWKEALSQTDPRPRIVDGIWSPMKDRLPKIAECLRTRLQGLALLTTDRGGRSLVYPFLKGGNLYAWRGYPPAEVPHVEAGALPAHFLDFYRVHDGWHDFFSKSMGPNPQRAWYFLSQILDEASRRNAEADLDPARLLVFFENGGGGFLGWDLTKAPPLSIIWWNNEPPDLLLNLWEALDYWISGDLERMDPA